MKYEDLPANLKRRVDVAEGRQPRRTGKGGEIGGAGHWRCHACGVETTGVFKHAEAHADQSGHHRIVTMLDPTP